MNILCGAGTAGGRREREGSGPGTAGPFGNDTQYDVVSATGNRSIRYRRKRFVSLKIWINNPTGPFLHAFRHSAGLNPGTSWIRAMLIVGLN